MNLKDTVFLHSFKDCAMEDTLRCTSCGTCGGRYNRQIAALPKEDGCNNQLGSGRLSGGGWLLVRSGVKSKDR